MELPVLAPAPPREPEWAHGPAMERGARCRECAAWGCARGPVLDEVPEGSPRAPGTGRGRLRLLIVAEAPGPNEIAMERPLVGWSGNFLQENLARVPSPEGDLLRRPWHGGVTLAKGNVTLCQPPGGWSFLEWHERLIHARKMAVLGRRVSWPEGCAPAEGWTLTPREACHPRLANFMAWSEDESAILTLGAEALAAVAKLEGLKVGKKNLRPKDLAVDDDEEGEDEEDAVDTTAAVHTLSGQNGAPITLSRKRVWVATYHPAFAARKKPWMGVVRDDIQRAARLAWRRPGEVVGSKVGWGRVDWIEPEALLFASADAYINWMDAVPAGVNLVNDIETGPSQEGKKDAADTQRNFLRCIGLGWSPDAPYLMGNVPGKERVAIVPVRHMDKRLWYSEVDTERVRKAHWAACERAHLVGQNFNFDLAVLLRDHYISLERATAGSDDTLLLHRNSVESDLPHNLAFMARRTLEVPVWKGVPHNSWDPIWDRPLHEYAVKDILVTLRIVEWARKSVVMAGNQASYGSDYALNPVLREMSSMGLIVDEHIRGIFAKKANIECAKLAARWVDLVGKRVNPSSPEQVGTLLYEDWGLTPVVATDGYEWDEGKPPATSRAALVALLRRELSDVQREALNVLLWYRGYQKLKGTYLEGFQVSQVEPELLEGLPSAPAIEGWQWTNDGRGASYEALPKRPALSRVFSSFRGDVTPSGRLASKKPNLMNIPSRGLIPVKEMLRAPPGHVFVGADWEQLEARLYAIEAQDRVLLETIAQGQDIHSMNAASLFSGGGDLMEWYIRINEAEEGERKAKRGIAKEFVFSLIYTAEALKIFASMSSKRDAVTGDLIFAELTPEQCEFWYDAWHRVHPETKQWHASIEQEVKLRAESRVGLGDQRARCFPWGPEKLAMAVNHKIQGAGGTLANAAMLQIRAEMGYRKWSKYSGLALQVHDDIEVYAPESRAEEASEILGRAMEQEIQGVPLPAPRDIGVYLIKPKQATRLAAELGMSMIA